MNGALNIDRLTDLLQSLHQITHLIMSLYDAQGTEIYACQSRSPFCELVRQLPQGRERCLACDQRTISSLTQPYVPLRYRCHAGLIDSIIPIAESGRLIATILVGQILDDSPLDVQWADTKRRCFWYPDEARLKEAFDRLPRLSEQQTRACHDIINACVSDIRLKELLKAGEQTDAQKLELYISQHYDQPLSIESLSQALAVSRSKLYLLASDIQPGLSIGALITRERVAAAKRLLGDPDLSVRDVAEKVGIPDYNYFTKVFKKSTDTTPSQYRKQHQPAQALPGQAAPPPKKPATK